MKHKVGDTVRIKPKEWYKANSGRIGEIKPPDGEWIYFTENMSKYCGMEAIITEVTPSCYTIDIDGGRGDWSDYMFEEETVVQKIKNSTSKPIDWEQRRYELVKSIMSNSLESIYRTSDNEEKVVSKAICLADELIKQLKESEGIK